MNLIRKHLISGVLILFFALSVWLSSGSAQDAAKKSDANRVLAVVNGKPITEADVRAGAREQFNTLERDYLRNDRALLETSLAQLVRDRLVEAEAEARKITREALLAEIKPAPVTDADVSAFYEQNKAQIPRPKEQVAPQIKQYLEQQSRQKAREKFFDALQAKYKFENKMEPFRVEVAATGPTKDPANAPVTLVLFSDFQSPFDARLSLTLKQVKEKYGDNIRLVFRQFPLEEIHPNARKAAEASLCAADQGKFWEMHDAMLANQQALTVPQLKAKAAELGLNAGQFNAGLDSGKHAGTIQTDMKEGSAAGVDATPAMFVNGRLIVGAVPLDQITWVIDDELRRKDVKPAAK